MTTKWSRTALVLGPAVRGGLDGYPVRMVEERDETMGLTPFTPPIPAFKFSANLADPSQSVDSRKVVVSASEEESKSVWGGAIDVSLDVRSRSAVRFPQISRIPRRGVRDLINMGLEHKTSGRSRRGQSGHTTHTTYDPILLVHLISRANGNDVIRTNATMMDQFLSSRRERLSAYTVFDVNIMCVGIWGEFEKDESDDDNCWILCQVVRYCITSVILMLPHPTVPFQMITFELSTWDPQWLAYAVVGLSWTGGCGVSDQHAYNL
ncbi:hypothetical protein BDN72DRAFT_856190 [Pluteus cervinus]|uniref:Uncharacterized protein n=1 Tax=Pluteus cervinus TaxID=181527 RepID=A0ACD3B0L6_9AGAR|nr:hypothetical protein BDN72DRAFT_856190 [Pluteus cervinus]